MKKIAVLPVADLEAPAIFWSLLVGELAVSVLLTLSGTLPSVLVRSLQFFLRF